MAVRPAAQIDLCLVPRAARAAETRHHAIYSNGSTQQPMVLWLGFLRSWQHMGMASVVCGGTCRCAPLVIDAHNFEYMNSVTAVARMEMNVSRAVGSAVRDAAAVTRSTPTDSSADELEGRQSGAAESLCCVVSITVLNRSSSPTGETKFKVLSGAVCADPNPL